MRHYQRNELCFDEISSLFYYDETSPSCLRYKRENACLGGKNKRYAGDVAGVLTQGYWRVTFKNKLISVHRVIYLLFNKIIDSDLVINHINNNSQDNKISNLEQVSTAINNRRKNIHKKEIPSGVMREVNFSKYKDKIYGPFECWTSHSYRLDGTTVRARFSIKKYGEEGAKELAIAHKLEQLSILNAQGAGYSEEHV